MNIRWLAIVNPVAGHPRSSHWKDSFAKRLAHELHAEVAFTEYPGHAEELARNSAHEGIAVFGGDGTVAEAVNGMDLERQRLLLLAGGTGNGLARDFGLTSLDKALHAARHDEYRRLDLVQVTFHSLDRIRSRLAISTASVGYAAEVVALANRYFKRLGGWCYPVSATLQAMRQPVLQARVSINDQPHRDNELTNIMINNTRHAGNFSAFRNSDPGDGKFEYLLAKAGFAAQFTHNLAVLSRTYFYRTAAEQTASSLALALPVPQRLMIDGELWEDIREARFEVLPGKLRCQV
jgi:undecaprenyl-diphosphatase